MSTRRRWFGLPFIAMGVALIIVDATIVNVAIPSIFADLGITSTQAQWIQESYTLVFASLLLVFGRVADRVGRRNMFILGVLIFAAASIAAAQVNTGDLLIAARFIQGIGGAMMLPTSLSLLNSTFTGKDRGIAFAVWGATIGAAAAFGPLLGGWLTTSYSWRWAFGINIPLGLLVITGVLIFIGESRGDIGERGADLIGALLSVLGIGSIVFGLIEGRNYGWFKSLETESFFGFQWTWSISPVFVSFVLGLLMSALFIYVEIGRNRAGKAVLLDLSLLRIASFRNANIVAAIVSLGEFGLLFALPLWLQNVLGYTAFRTGVLLLSLALGSFVASGAGAPLGIKRGAAAVVRLGIFLELVGILISGAVIAVDTKWWMIALPLFVYGSGVGLATAQLTGVALAEIPSANSGQASGITSTTRQLGSALGIAILGTTLFTSFSDSMQNKLLAAQIPAAQANELTAATVKSAGSLIGQLAADPATVTVADAAKYALSHGTQLSAYAGAAFLLIGWVASRRLKSPINTEE